MSSRVELINITPNAEKHIEYCARVCYNSLNKISEDSYKKLLPRLLKMGHYSVLSHAHATFVISGISRACSHQLVRHAHLRYLQRSQRYCDESATEFVYPIKGIKGKIFGLTYKLCKLSYKLLRILGVKQENARFVLPNAIGTTIVVSGTFQAWWDFLRLRLGKHAQWEIRKVAKEIYKILNKRCPHIFNKELLVVQPQLNLDF